MTILQKFLLYSGAATCSLWCGMWFQSISHVQARNGGHSVTVIRVHTLENTLIPFVSLTSLRVFYLPTQFAAGRSRIYYTLELLHP